MNDLVEQLEFHVFFVRRNAMSKQAKDFAVKCSSLFLFSTSFEKGNAMKTRSRTNSVLSLAAVAATCLALASSASAAPITVVNHSFEDGIDGSGGSINQPPWARAGNPDTNNTIPIQELSGIAAQSDPAPDGTDTTHYTNNNTTDNIYQVLTATLLANTTYTLNVDVGDRTDLTAQSGAIRLGYVSGTPTVDNDYGLNLLAATVINDTVPVNTGASTTDGWETWESTFTTGASPTGLGQQLRVELVSFGGVQTLWDNVHLDAVTQAATPEPSTAILAALGFVGLMGTRRRRNRR